ncbi:MAG: PfkB family carbohydrate kinase [Lacibacter sp.]
MVCTFGELLLRMSPVLHRRWIAEANMPVYIGGAELNVATALATWDVPVKYLTRLPDHYLAREIEQHLQQTGINTAGIQWGGNRVGTYYLPQGTDLKHAGVIYDRAYSAFWELQPGTVNWEALLEGCAWLHWSAITPALNETLAAVCSEVVAAARKKGITISVDLNYRSKLWQYGVQPATVMAPLVQQCDVVMGNLWAAESLLNIPSPVAESKGLTRQQLLQAAATSMQAVQHQFPRVRQLAYTFRLEETYFGVLHDGAELHASHTYSTGHLVDKVGSGDCFMAGLIYGMLRHMPAPHTINFAAAAAVGKMAEVGDATRQTVAAIEQRIATQA